jgi:IclR family acetate operon transcriptional repressor
VPVKRSRSASRVLAVLEAIARHQPIGVSELARILQADKSAVQRGIMTLADEGWICTAPGAPAKWRLTARVLAVAHTSHMKSDLRQRARATLERVRQQSNETVLLAVPDMNRFVVVEALESRQLLRAVPHVGMTIQVRGTATGRALLPYMRPEQQIEYLGEAPDAPLLAEFAQMRERGYSYSDGELHEGSSTIAAPIIEVDGYPSAAIVVVGPSERLIPKRAEVGAMVMAAARSLSHGTAPLRAASA